MLLSIKDNINDKKKSLSQLFIAVGLIGIVTTLSLGNLPLFGIILLCPIFIITLYFITNYPVILLYIIFIFSYLVLGISRYIEISGISVVFDILLFCSLLLPLIHSIILRNVQWKQSLNVMNIALLCWAVFCLLEIANPTAMINAWMLSRLLIYGGLLASVAIALVVSDKKHIKYFLRIYSVLSLLAVMKAIMQKYIGFDEAELKWLAEGGGITHLISTGTRYFSFFTDAGNFGSNMGCASVIFGITSFVIKNKYLKVYYLLTGALCFYAMMLSGTRGAMIVPLGGIATFIIISKNIKAIGIGSILLLFIYVFFAFTTIGQNNDQIRRMRTAFRPNEDGSFLVRKQNREKLGQYLKNKPFGEGLGLAGVENQKTSFRFTTSIPHDSWYVKIWVETGIVGLLLYIGILLVIVGRCSYILMFKIKNTELKGLLSAMLCGIVGMMLSAYGNAFWGQFPTMIISFMFLALIMKGDFFDKQLTTKETAK
ncbi:MAG: O-antigen ligase family protein [Bacteroidaceae bacterium]